MLLHQHSEGLACVGIVAEGFAYAPLRASGLVEKELLDSRTSKLDARSEGLISALLLLPLRLRLFVKTILRPLLRNLYRGEGVRWHQKANIDIEILLASRHRFLALRLHAPANEMEKGKAEKGREGKGRE